jgi:hypothetical protein
MCKNWYSVLKTYALVDVFLGLNKRDRVHFPSDLIARRVEIWKMNDRKQDNKLCCPLKRGYKILKADEQIIE